MGKKGQKYLQPEKKTDILKVPTDAA